MVGGVGFGEQDEERGQDQIRRGWEAFRGNKQNHAHKDIIVPLVHGWAPGVLVPLRATQCAPES